jgi:acetyl-CoA synthetase
MDNLYVPLQIPVSRRFSHADSGYQKNSVKRTTAPYKYPREIEFVIELPKTISGKIKRNELRAAELKKYTGIR